MFLHCYTASYFTINDLLIHFSTWRFLSTTCFSNTHRPLKTQYYIYTHSCYLKGEISEYVIIATGNLVTNMYVGFSATWPLCITRRNEIQGVAETHDLGTWGQQTSCKEVHALVYGTQCACALVVSDTPSLLVAILVAHAASENGYIGHVKSMVQNWKRCSFRIQIME